MSCVHHFPRIRGRNPSNLLQREWRPMGLPGFPAGPYDKIALGRCLDRPGMWECDYKGAPLAGQEHISAELPSRPVFTGYGSYSSCWERPLSDSSQLSWRSASLSFQVRDANQGKASGFLRCMGEKRVRRQGAIRKPAGWAWSKQKQGGQLCTPVSKPLIWNVLCLCLWVSNFQGHLSIRSQYFVVYKLFK